MIAGMLANPLAYIIMKASPWLSIYLGLLILALCIILCFALPETRKERPLTEVTSDHSEQQGNHVGVLHNSLEQARAGVRQLGNFLLRLAREERQGFTLLLSLLLTTFGKDAGLMLMQYITVKFHWEWSEVSCILHGVFLIGYQYVGNDLMHVNNLGRTRLDYPASSHTTSVYRLHPTRYWSSHSSRHERSAKRSLDRQT